MMQRKRLSKEQNFWMPKKLFLFWGENILDKYTGELLGYK